MTTGIITVELLSLGLSTAITGVDSTTMPGFALCRRVVALSGLGRAVFSDTTDDADVEDSSGRRSSR